MFHQYWFSQGGVTGNIDGRKVDRVNSYIYPEQFVCMGEGDLK